MKRYFVLITCISLFLMGCNMSTEHRDKQVAGEVGSAANAVSEVLMVYMVGSDLESNNGFASLDIEEMCNSQFQESNLKVIVCTGGAAYWWNEDISENECAVFDLHPGEGLEKMYTLNNENMAEPATLTEFMDYVYDNYDADYYSMVFWNHGGGAVLGYGEDENHDYDTLSLYELDTAFSESKFISKQKKLEWIGFDACLMGMLEVANVFSSYAGYLVASEEMEAGYGWDYSFLAALSDGRHYDGEAAGKEIIDTYSAYYDAFERYQPEYTLSCMDLSKCDEVVISFEEFIEAASDELHSGHYSILAKNRERIKSFGIISETECYDTIDLLDFADHFKNVFPEEANNLEQAVRDMIVYKKENVAGANGIAVYFPYHNKDYAVIWVEEYGKIGFSRVYTDFVKEFAGSLSGENMAEWDIAATVPIADETRQDAYYVILNDDQIANFARAKLSIWEQVENWGEGSYVLWMNSSETLLEEDGKLWSFMEQKHFVIGDSSGHSADCSAVEIERTDAYAVYEINLLTQYFDEDTFENSMELVILQVRVDEEYPQGVITGIYRGQEDEASRLPEKAGFDIKQGADINPIAFIRNISVDENGDVAPFAEWESKSSLFDGFTLDGDLTVSLVDMEEAADKSYVFFVTDTQGNTYVTNIVQ